MDDDLTCVFCDHPVARHGLDQEGCSDCGCGADPDWYDE